MHERVSLITMIFSNPNQVNVVNDLSGNDAQAFVDKIDEASSRAFPRSQDKLTGFGSWIPCSVN